MLAIFKKFFIRLLEKRGYCVSFGEPATLLELFPHLTVEQSISSSSKSVPTMDVNVIRFRNLFVDIVGAEFWWSHNQMHLRS